MGLNSIIDLLLDNIMDILNKIAFNFLYDINQKIKNVTKFKTIIIIIIKNPNCLIYF